MPMVTFSNEKRSIDVPQGANLRKEVEQGEENLTKPGLWERLHMLINPFGFFSRLGSDKPVRLACQTRVKGDCQVEARPAMNWHGEKFWE
jgi:hypothetical protein